MTERDDDYTVEAYNRMVEADEEETPVAFRDLPAEMFPFVIEFLRADTGAVVHRIRIEGPGAVTVPPLGKQLGVEIQARIVEEDQ